MFYLIWTYATKDFGTRSRDPTLRVGIQENKKTIGSDKTGNRVFLYVISYCWASGSFSILTSPVRNGGGGNKKFKKKDYTSIIYFISRKKKKVKRQFCTCAHTYKRFRVCSRILATVSHNPYTLFCIRIKMHDIISIGY